MRKIVAGLFVSVDGVAESPDRFVFPYFSDEVGAVVGASMESCDAMLLGRKLYQEWAEYWPDKTNADDGFADFINDTQKYVLSTTLDSVEWRNSTLIEGDAREQIQRLKEQPGKDIGMSGSMTTVAWLLREGLLDELSLLVFPVVVGSGKRLFEADEKIGLKLIESRALDTGVLSLRYAREGSQ